MNFIIECNFPLCSVCNKLLFVAYLSAALSFCPGQVAKGLFRDLSAWQTR